MGIQTRDGLDWKGIAADREAEVKRLTKSVKTKELIINMLRNQLRANGISPVVVEDEHA